MFIELYHNYVWLEMEDKHTVRRMYTQMHMRIE